MNIPVGYATVTPYICVNGALKFIEFAKNVFGAEEIFKELNNDRTVKHAEIKIGGSVIMLAEETLKWPAKSGDFFIYVEDADKTYEKALEEGAASVMPPTDQSYGRSGGVTDPFGNTWWITTPPEE